MARTAVLVSVAAILFLALVSSAALAQRAAPPSDLPPPALMVKTGDASEPLALTKVAIDARIIGHLAETRVTMTFSNPHGRALAGDLYFPLPAGAIVSGYALDIDGAMVDGVVVTKDKARQVFEAEVRKGIDPGLVEWVKGNNFKTRVFPIPAHGARTVMVRYAAELAQSGEAALYMLPLRFRDPVGELSLRVEAVKAAARPEVTGGELETFRFTSWRDSFVAEATFRDVALQRDLAIRLPDQRRQPVRVERAPDGKAYFVVRDLPRLPVVVGGELPKRVVVLWDASLSRAGASHDREIGLLGAYLDRLTAAGARFEVALRPFRHRAEPDRPFAVPAQRDALLAAIRAIRYDGGTQMASIGSRPIDAVPAPDHYLLFSDGVSNFGAERPARLDAPVYVFNAASTASHDFLRWVALSSGGAYFDLLRTPDERALPAIGRAAFTFLGAEVEGGADLDLYPRLREPVSGPFDLAGVLTGDEARITLVYGVGGRAEVRTTHVVRLADASEGDLLRRYWAGKKVQDLLVFPKRNADEIAAVGQAYGLVTPGTSLIVLERLDQYVQHEIRPPASLAEMRAEWDGVMARRRTEKASADEDKLAHVLELWKARVQWWKKTYRYPKGFRFGGAEGEADDEDGPTAGGSGRGGGGSARMGARARIQAIRVGSASPAPAAPAEAEHREEAEARDPEARPRRARAEVAGGTDEDGRSKSAEADAAPAERPEPEPAVVLKPWDPDTPYLKALAAAPSAERFAVYLAQRQGFGTSPAFFLDCADFFRRAGEDAVTLQILSNVAELELENAALLRVLAHRLAQLGHLDLAAAVFEEVLRMRPEEPQSYRDLALVLERRADAAVAAATDARRAQARADYARALELLARVVMNAWDRFDEIEVIALTELNHVLPKARAVGHGELPVDARLVQHLDMDVRIVMTWDADLTDMDLHVVEPSREEAYYSHNRTTIGGLVSRDFTQGYGPEVYALRRAMHGTYAVKAKYYSSSAAQLIGPVTLQVDVYTRYGQPGEKRQSMTFRLTEAKEMFDVGEIEI